LAAKGDSGDYIVVVSRENYADGNLSVIGTVGGVEGTRAVVEAYFATDFGPEGFG
jgi:hypothetical protein